MGRNRHRVEFGSGFVRQDAIVAELRAAIPVRVRQGSMRLANVPGINLDYFDIRVFLTLHSVYANQAFQSKCCSYEIWDS